MGDLIDLAAERRKRRPEPRATGGILESVADVTASGPTADDLFRTWLYVRRSGWYDEQPRPTGSSR
jgi:hypothetical protein